MAEKTGFKVEELACHVAETWHMVALRQITEGHVISKYYKIQCPPISLDATTHFFYDAARRKMDFRTCPRHWST